MVYLEEREVECFDLSGCEGLRSFLADSEFASHGFAPDELLITAEQVRWCEGIGAASMRCGGARRREVLRVDVDELHVKVGVGAAGGDVQLRAQRSGKRDVLGEGVGLVDEDVRARRGVALVGNHVVAGRTWSVGIGDLGNGMGGIACVLVVSSSLCSWSGWIEGELASGLEIDHARFRAGRRPSGVGFPDVRAGFEHRGRGEVRIGGVLQVVLKEREFDFLAEVVAGVRAEVDIGDALAIKTVPAAVDPRSFHDAD